MSTISRMFPDQLIGTRHRSWPLSNNSPLRNKNVSVGVTFKKDAGYLSIDTIDGSENIKIKGYPTKTMLKRNLHDVIFHCDMTTQEFEKEGLNPDKIKVEYGMDDNESINNVTHMMKLFSDLIGNPGLSYGRRTSIML